MMRETRKRPKKRKKRPKKYECIYIVAPIAVTSAAIEIRIGQGEGVTK